MPNIMNRILSRLAKPCDRCVLSWEDRTYEGECDDCGCLLYGDLDAGRIACVLPNCMLRWYRKRKDAQRDACLAAEGEAMMEWALASEKKDALFLEALNEKLFTDASGAPKAPLYRSPNGQYYPYEPTDRWAAARLNYEGNLDQGMPPVKAFQKAIAEYLTPELYYYDEKDARYDTFRIFANSGAAREAYHEKLKQAGLE